MIFLENEHIQTTFVVKGAELQSLKSKSSGMEYIWSGEPAYWGKHSPILFPLVGALKDQTYIYNKKSYLLPRHGFARDMDFTYQQLSATEVIFTLEETGETLQVYPFRFKLDIRYVLSGHTLSCSYEVSNPDPAKELLFSVGGHPAFAVPFKKGELYTDYFLEFNKDEQLCYHKVERDLIAREVETLKLDGNRLHLQHELFYNDALVLKTLKSDCISIKNNTNQSALHFKFKGFPYFGIWAAKDADFICLEPWCGIADGVEHDQQLKNKEGIETLAEGQTWKRTWEAEIA
jgi:galactose mutarotase-like enzyme